LVTAVIIQARLGSSRLPAKVLMPLGRTTVIDEVIRRCRAIPGVDVVCCAIPAGKADEPLARAAERAGAVVFQGDETDVLSRYAKAAVAVGADIVMRVPADKPLIDPQICGAVLRLVATGEADYACNNMPPSWPHGLDCEVFTAQILRRAEAETVEPADREHVTPWMRRHPDIRRANLAGPGGAVVDQRWTLDLPEDLAFLKALFDELPPPPAMPGYEEIAHLLEQRPDILKINAQWGHLSRVAGVEGGARSVIHTAAATRA
jgi:spore coat polysaccharide biosynthesis protein SpsF